MAKGSGLSIDSDPIGFFLHKPTVINSFPENNNHTKKWKLNLFSTTTTTTTNMETTVNKSSPPTIQFPVNLNCSHEDDHHHQEYHHDDDDVDHAPSDEKRTVIDEMDFFADSKHDVKALSDSNTNDKNIESNGPTCFKFNVNTGLHLLTANTSSDQSMVDDGISPNSEDKVAKVELAVLQAELERMNGENQRLKEMLNQVTSNYNALQMHLVTMVQDQKAENNEEHNGMVDMKVEDYQHKKDINGHGSGGGLMVPRQFMDLGLANTTADHPTDHESSISSLEGRSQERSRSPLNNIGEDPKNAFNEREDSPDQVCWGSSNKVPRLSPSKNDVAAATEATMRKARVSVRARSEAPMITDGCQWRKYGQKMAKGNPCPRAYYRCTMAAGCPVRKQVQRCAEDRTILITTYEGNHNHPLPPAAMAMASTTSSAARMLLSGSMPSADGLMNSNILARTLLPCSSNMATISASAPFPTVTLDLTQNPNPLQFQRPPPINQFHVPFSNQPQAFGTNAALLPQIFSQALYNQSKFSGLQMSQDMDCAAQSGHNQSQSTLPQHINQQSQQPNSLADTVTAIAADPHFTAALAAAITSIIGGGGQPNINNNNNNTANTTNTTNNGSMTPSNSNSKATN